MAMLGLNPKVWITLGPILVINFLFLISLLAYTYKARSKKLDVPESAGRHTSKFLSLHLKEWWVFITDPIAKLFVRMGARPSVLTFIGFLFSAAAAILFANGLFGYAGWTMIFGATFDIFDGRVARLTGQETRSGAFYDSVMDRFGEGVCFLGLAFYFRESFILFFVIAGLVGSMLVSYTKARGESVGVLCKGGVMQRPERIVYLGVSSVLDPISSTILLNWFAVPPPVLVIGAVIIIAVMTNATAVHRMIFIMNEMDTADKSKRETIPQIITKLTTSEGREALLTKARYGYDRSRARYSHIILFLLDGADIGIMEDLLKSGDLPNIQRHVIERGSFSRAVSAFPSATGPAFTPFVTGCFPGTCNVPAVRWFDRSVPPLHALTLNRFRDYMGWGAYAMDFDLSKSVRTVFEYSRKAVNIFGMVNRGCGIIRDPAFFRLRSLFKGAGRKTDLKETEEIAFEWFEDAILKETDFVFYSFPSVDVAGKGKNPVIESYRRFDNIVGRAATLLKEHGMFDETAIFISSDHGHGNFESSFDLAGFLSERFKTLIYPAKARRWQEFQAIPFVSGTSMAHVYLKKDNDWGANYFFEEIEKTGMIDGLLEKDEIDIVAGRSADGGVLVVSRRGRAGIKEASDGRISYNVKGADPFGYENMPQTIDPASALSLTEKTNHPDGIMQILQMFRSQRTGDIVISAASGCTLEGRKTTRTHGSLMREHLIVPFISSVKGDCPLLGTVPFIRTADIFALTLGLMGIEPEHGLDSAIPQHLRVGEA